MISSSVHEKAFSTQVDNWVETALHAGAGDLESLLLALPGVYPTEVLKSVKRLGVRGTVSKRLASSIGFSATPTVRAVETRASLSTLPAPHPLDYDWRFTKEAGSEIVDVAHSLGERLVCIGAPSVFSVATQRRMFDDATLIDRNRAIVNHFGNPSPTVILCDVLTDQLPQLRADVIVTDPPWYHEHFRAFLWAASEICGVGGYVLLSLPMKGTRPGVLEERGRIFDWAARLGFNIYELDEGGLYYETPPFEKNALLAAGVALQGGAWRRGTLCVLRKMSDLNVERPLFIPSIHDSWDEASLFGTRFFFRQGVRIGFDDPSLIPLVSGSILPSVSRTHPLRPHVDVWTSGNRVFRCRSPRLVKSIADTLAIDGDLGDVVGFRGARPSLRLIDQTAQMLQDLASMERNERQFFGNG